MFHRPRQEEETSKDKDVGRNDSGKPVVAVKPAAPRENEFRPAAVQAAPQPSAITKSDMFTKEEKNMTSADQTGESTDTQTRTFEKTYTAPGQNPAQVLQQKSRGFAAGGYAAPASSPYSTSADQANKTQGRRLVIGEGIHMSGEIDSCEHLTVEGSVQAALKGASILEIAETGVFYGTVEIDEATIAGRFEGDILVNGRLTIKSTGSVTGSLVYKELAVEAGAVVDGKISPLASMGAGKKSGKDRDIKTKSVPPRNDNGDEGSELPFASSASAG